MTTLSWHVVSVDYRLHVFRHVAENLNFTRASKLLHISQPAVTQHIKLLEEEIGLPLFKRSGRSIRLSNAGCLLLEHARMIEKLAREITQEIHAQEGLMQGELHLGATSTIAQYLLPKWLVASRHRWPNLRLQITEGNTQEVVNALVENRVQFSLIEGRYKNPGLKSERLLQDEILCVASPRHHLASCRNISLKQLSTTPILFREKGSGTRDHVEAALAQKGLAPADMNIDLELRTSEAIKAVITTGHGIAFLSKIAIQKELLSGELVPIQVAGMRIERPIEVLFPAGPKPTGPAQSFLQLVREMLPRPVTQR